MAMIVKFWEFHKASQFPLFGYDCKNLGSFMRKFRNFTIQVVRATIIITIIMHRTANMFYPPQPKLEIAQV